MERHVCDGYVGSCKDGGIGLEGRLEQGRLV